MILGGHATTCWVDTRNPGYHARNVASQSPFRMRVRNRAWGERVIDRQDIVQELSGDAIRHQRRPFRFQKEQLRCEMLWEQGSQGTERLGGVRMTRALVQAGTVDRDGSKTVLSCMV